MNASASAARHPVRYGQQLEAVSFRPPDRRESAEAPHVNGADQLPCSHMNLMRTSRISSSV